MEYLEKKLTIAPILRVPNLENKFLIINDACGEEVGGVLVKEEKVIMYESRKLKNYEKIYSPHDLKLAAIVHALQMWRNYFIGKPFEL